MTVAQQQDMFPEPKEDWAESYRQHSTTLRNWFVLYGIGGPVVLMSNEKIWDTISKSENAKCIGLAFLFGVMFQIILSILDKHAAWIGYYSKMNRPHQYSLKHRLARCWTDTDWLSIVLDIASVSLFGFATVKTLGVLL